jgi:hypothetical protein
VDRHRHAAAELRRDAHGQGAVRFDPADSSYTRFDVASGLPTNTLNGVTVTHDGDVWFATPLGAARLRGGGITTFTTAQGLPSNNVTRVAEDASGRLWFATAGGLAEFDGLNWTVYTVGDGLAGGSLANVFADSLGILAAAQSDGASLFRPDGTPPRAEIQLAPAACERQPGRPVRHSRRRPRQRHARHPAGVPARRRDLDPVCRGREHGPVPEPARRHAHVPPVGQGPRAQPDRHARGLDVHRRRDRRRGRSCRSPRSTRS